MADIVLTSGSTTLAADPTAAQAEAEAAQSAADEAAKTATNYIEPIDDGIKVKASNNDYTEIKSDGMHVYEGGNSVASFRADKVELGKGNSGAQIEMCDGNGLIDYDYASGAYSSIVRLTNSLTPECSSSPSSGEIHHAISAIGDVVHSGVARSGSYSYVKASKSQTEADGAITGAVSMGAHYENEDSSVNNTSSIGIAGTNVKSESRINARSLMNEKGYESSIFQDAAGTFGGIYLALKKLESIGGGTSSTIRGYINLYEASTQAGVSHVDIKIGADNIYLRDGAVYAERDVYVGGDLYVNSKPIYPIKTTAHSQASVTVSANSYKAVTFSNYTPTDGYTAVGIVRLNTGNNNVGAARFTITSGGLPYVQLRNFSSSSQTVTLTIGVLEIAI